jgi:hypothetical protein
MSVQTHTCDEDKKAGIDNPCITEIQTDLKWVKQGLDDFRTYYAKAHEELIRTNNIDHKEIIDRVKITNGNIAEVKVWKGRVEGMIISLSTLGIITWIGKSFIAWFEK